MLIDGYASVPSFRAATGMEQHGLGDIPGLGTDPMFLNPIVEIDDDSNPLAWTITPASEYHLPSDFLLGPSSPAIDAGIPLRPGLPDTRFDPNRDIGAIPFGSSADQYLFFPFDPNAPARPRGVVTANP